MLGAARSGDDDDEALARALDGTPYSFVRRLGRGGMGVVVEATHATLGTTVAVKLAAEGTENRHDALERFRIEAQTLARIGHPGLVRVVDLGRTPSGRVYFVMDRLVGRTLRAELDARGAVPCDEAASIARAMLDALGAAHEVGVVHRDVKPENVFLAAAGVKVLDFGIAKVLAEAEGDPRAPEPSAYPTRTGALVGTPPWLAPEQIGDGAVSPATDVYAAGLVLYRMVAGRHAFGDLTGGELLRAHLTTMPPPPSRVARQPVPPWLDAAVMRAIAKDPRDRFASARAFADALGKSAPASVARPSSADGETRSMPPETVAATPTAAASPAAIRSQPAAIRSAAAAEPFARRARVLGVIGVVLGPADFFLRVLVAARAVSVLADTESFAREIAALDVQTGSTETLRQLAMRAAPAELLGAGLLGATSAAALVVGARLLRYGPRALGAMRTWSLAALATTALAMLLDLAYRIPAVLEYGRLIRHGDAFGGDTVAVATTVLTIALALGFELAYGVGALAALAVSRHGGRASA